MNTRRGFSLLEVLVATVVMGIAVTGLIVGLSNSVRNASKLADYDRVAMLARTKMNDLLLDNDLPFEGSVDGNFDADQTGSAPAGWHAVVKPFELPPVPAPNAPMLQEIALQIWWQPATGTRRTLQLSGYRQARIPLPEGL